MTEEEKLKIRCEDLAMQVSDQMEQIMGWRRRALAAESQLANLAKPSPELDTEE